MVWGFALPLPQGAGMTEVMSKVRTVLQIDEEIRDVLRLESALTSKDMGEIVEELIRQHLPEQLEQIRGRRAKRPNKDKKS